MFVLAVQSASFVPKPPAGPLAQSPSQSLSKARSTGAAGPCDHWSNVDTSLMSGMVRMPPYCGVLALGLVVVTAGGVEELVGLAAVVFAGVEPLV